jgi:hypothetical protein
MNDFLRLVRRNNNTLAIAVASSLLTVCSAAFVFQLRGVGMKKALLLTIALLCISSLVFAQAGSIGVFADPGGAVCDLVDFPGLVVIYVVHVYTPGATGSQFSLTENHLMTYLAETVTAPYLKIGTCAGPAGFGCAIAYGGCYASPNMMLMVQYFGNGITPPCGTIQVDVDYTAAIPGMYVSDCADPPNLLTGTGGTAFINNDGSCPCNIPVEETSWGQIKSLYK